MDEDADRYDPALEGAAETLLLPLYARAAEARHPDSVLRDPVGIALIDRLDFPFRERFGDAVDLGQGWALHAASLDREVRAFLAFHPGGRVVSLGEGLETQFWRVDDGSVCWLTVDRPEVLALRRRLLPADSPRQQEVSAGSTVDPSWTESINGTDGVLVVARGLGCDPGRGLPPAEAQALVAACAGWVPGATLLLVGPTRADLQPLDRRAVRVREVLPPRGRGILFGSVLPVLARVPFVRGAATGPAGVTGPPVTAVELAADVS